MSLYSGLRIGWNVTLLVIDAKTDRVLRRIRTHNMIVNTGLNKFRDMMGYPDATCDGKTPDYIALGTDATAAAAAQTTLIAEVFRKEVSNRVPDTYTLTYYLDVTAAEANGNSLKEVGLFTEAAGGTLWARATHTTVAKTVSIRLQYQWEFTFADA
jgi:hypothetical protein